MIEMVLRVTERLAPTMVTGLAVSTLTGAALWKLWQHVDGRLSQAETHLKCRHLAAEWVTDPESPLRAVGNPEDVWNGLG
jgi:hypothetical protein